MGSQPPSPQEAPPVIVLSGEQIALAPMSRALLPHYQRWGNDFGVTRTMYLAAPLTAEQLAVAYEQTATDQHSVSLTIYDRRTWEPIGNTAWVDIDRRDRTAEYILYLGEAGYRGRGIGTEVTALMLRYAFETLGLHNVMLRVYAFNLAGQRAYTKAGFREFGRRREAKLLGGKQWDVVYMECLATEYLAGDAAKSDPTATQQAVEQMSGASKSDEQGGISG